MKKERDKGNSLKENSKEENKCELFLEERKFCFVNLWMFISHLLRAKKPKILSLCLGLVRLFVFGRMSDPKKIIKDAASTQFSAGQIKTMSKLNGKGDFVCSFSLIEWSCC